MPRAFLIKAKKDKKKEEELGTQFPQDSAQFSNGVSGNLIQAHLMLRKFTGFYRFHGFSSVRCQARFFWDFRTVTGFELCFHDLTCSGFQKFCKLREIFVSFRDRVYESSFE